MKGNIALLIVDLQAGFNPTKKLIQGILKKAREYPIVVATRFAKGNSLYKKVLGHSDFKKKDFALAGLPKRAKVFKKTGYGLPRALLKYLKKHSITRVDVCGLQTDACVLAAMYDLWDSEIQPKLLRNLSATVSSKMKNAALVIVRRNFKS